MRKKRKMMNKIQNGKMTRKMRMIMMRRRKKKMKSKMKKE